ncbi:MAG: arginyltransferase [Pseudomonadota bacterium]
MALMNDVPFAKLQFYATAPYPCSYLDDRLARSQVATPSHLIDKTVYSKLVSAGFRRSGAFTYRPHCENCQACIPVRVVVDDFAPNRTQRRTEKRLRHLTTRVSSLRFDSEHYALYRRYQVTRHPGGGMDQDSREQYCHFLLQSHVPSFLVEFRDGPYLRMVSVIDELDDGLSSVYTFFDPDLLKASFGVYNVLWQIRCAQELGLPYLYLGYWIRESRKMSYKTDYQPLEGLIENMWQPMERQARQGLDTSDQSC